MTFVPRSTFLFPSRTPSWYLGHMVRSLREMTELLSDIDLVVEVRDARLPLTSINGAFDAMLDKAWGTHHSLPPSAAPRRTLEDDRTDVVGAGLFEAAAELERAKEAEREWQESALGDSVAESSAMAQAKAQANNLNGKGKKVWTEDGQEVEVMNKSRGYNIRVDRKGRLREKLVVYTKCDLAEQKYESPLIKAFRRHQGQKVMFANTSQKFDVQRILQYAKNVTEKNRSESLKILVVGMPNVGKSSLLNALRRFGVGKKKHFQTGAMAGVTRKIGGTVKISEDPLIYVYDAPGIMVPFLGHGAVGAERGLKFALTGGIKEDLFEQEAVLDYFLWRMNRRMYEQKDLPKKKRGMTYLEGLPLPKDFTEPTDDLYALLDAVCAKTGALKKGGDSDYETSMTFIRHFLRDGKLGRWTLDDLESTPDPPRFEELDDFEEGPMESYTASSAGDPPVEATPTLAAMPMAPIKDDANLDPLAARKALDQRVSNAVKAYLDLMAQQKIDTEQGRNLSPTAQLKKEVEEKAERRTDNYKARMAAKGIDVDEKEKQKHRDQQRKIRFQRRLERADAKAKQKSKKKQ